MMKVSLNKLIFGCVCVVFSYSCEETAHRKAKVVIVPSNTNDQPREFYYSYNFILDTSNNIFYYQRPIYERGSGVLNTWDTIPRFLDLEPSDIIQLPEKDIDQFVRLNLLNSEYGKTASLASAVDTIKSLEFIKIMSLFDDTSNHVKWILRKPTIEENVVLNYKRNYEVYVPQDIEWDSTKTLFAEFRETMQNEQIDKEFKKYEK